MNQTAKAAITGISTACALLTTGCGFWWYILARGSCTGTGTGQNSDTLLCQSGDILLVGFLLINVLLAVLLILFVLRGNPAPALSWSLFAVYVLYALFLISPLGIVFWALFLTPKLTP